MRSNFVIFVLFICVFSIPSYAEIGDGLTGITDSVFDYAGTAAEAKVGKNNPQADLVGGVLDGAQEVVSSLIHGIFGGGEKPCPVPTPAPVVNDPIVINDPPMPVANYPDPKEDLIIQLLIAQEAKNSPSGDCSKAVLPQQAMYCQCQAACAGTSPVITPDIAVCISKVCGEGLGGAGVDLSLAVYGVPMPVGPDTYALPTAEPYNPTVIPGPAYTGEGPKVQVFAQ